MRIGFIGLGKLGLPTALAIESRGHAVFGHDPSAEVQRIVRSRSLPYREAGAQELLRRSRLELRGVEETLREADLVFVTIQTPHHPDYEGVTPLPAERRDFDYGFLLAGMREVAEAARRTGKECVVVLVSTVLPGTMRREILPLLGGRVKLCYNPFFIAMGSAIEDFLHPEFVLFGAEEPAAAERAEAFYRSLHDAPFFRTTLENAELIKVLYNTAISTKLAFASAVMELCHGVPGTDCDVVIDALSLATQRIVSPRYLRGGMGDGGACHPRDNIALSHLSRRLGLPFDWFECVMLQRQAHTGWLADLFVRAAAGRPLMILGRSFKPESNILCGSPSLLLSSLLKERGHEAQMWDPHVDEGALPPAASPRAYFIGTKHPEFAALAFEPGAVVLDPWRYIPEREGVEVIRIGGRGGG